MTARTRTFVASLFTICIALATAAPAAAAPPSTGGAGPEEEACAGRGSGDACSMPNNQLGICAAATCSRLDYSGGSPPKSIEEACVVCKPAGAGGHEDMPMLGGDGGAEPPPADSGAEPASTTGSKEPPESSSRCQVSANSASPAGLALLAGLLLFARRRRAPKLP